LDVILLSDPDDLTWDQWHDLKQQILRHRLVRAENQQVDMFAPDEVDDFILEIGVDRILGHTDIVLTGVIDQVLQGFMKPDGLLRFRSFGRCLLKNMNVCVQPVRQRQGVMDTPEIIGVWPDGDEDFSLVHGGRPPSFHSYKACAKPIFTNIYSKITKNDELQRPTNVSMRNMLPVQLGSENDGFELKSAGYMGRFTLKPFSAGRR